jgi:hypothetical protein
VVYGYDAQPISNWIGGGAGGADGAFGLGQHHVALTHEANFNSTSQSRLELYLNGTFRAGWLVDPTESLYHKDPLLPPMLGACNVRGTIYGEDARLRPGIFRGHFFHGHMEEVRLWDDRRSAVNIGDLMLLTGPAGDWPALEVENGNLTALKTQYTFDVLTSQVHDSTSNGFHGLLGSSDTERYSPVYETSPFAVASKANLQYGSVLVQLRGEQSTEQVDFLPFVFSADTTFAGLRIEQAPSNIKIHIPGSSVPLTAGDTTDDLTLVMVASSATVYDSFAVRPCAGIPGMPLDESLCDPYQIYRVSVSVSGTNKPLTGPSYAIQLLGNGAAVHMPIAPPTFSVEFWTKFRLPVYGESYTVFSAWEKEESESTSLGLELIRIHLDSTSDTFQSGGALLELCNNAGGSISFSKHTLAGLATDAPMHLAISIEWTNNTQARVSVSKDCVQLVDIALNNPCMSSTSPSHVRSTIGQRYVAHQHDAQDGSVSGITTPLGNSYATMYVDEIRVWNYNRHQSGDICSTLQTPLVGNEVA